MGAPNIALLGEDTVFTWFQTLGLTKNTAVICTGLLFAAVVILLQQVSQALDVNTLGMQPLQLADFAQADEIPISAAFGASSPPS